MGLAGSAAAAVLVLGALASARVFFGAVTEGQRAEARLEEERLRHLARVAQSSIRILNASFAPVPNPVPVLPPVEGHMYLNLTNDGGVVLNVSRTTVLFNGTAYPLEGFSRKTVDGVATDVWAPGQTLWLIELVNQGTALTHRYVVAETGASAAHRS